MSYKTIYQIKKITINGHIDAQISLTHNLLYADGCYSCFQPQSLL